MFRLYAYLLLCLTLSIVGCAQKQSAAEPNLASNWTPAAPGTERKTTESTPALSGGNEASIRVSRPVGTISVTTHPGILYHMGPAGSNAAALTFDDGPDTVFTPKILDILKQHGVHATFFLIGTRAKTHPEMVKRIQSEGHVIGNHTWDHPQMTKLTAEQVKTEINQTTELINHLIGYRPVLFRPPYGALSPADIQEIGSLGYKIIDWSVDSRDWAGTPAPQIMSYVKTEFHPGGIILQHCAGGKNENLSNTLQSLPQIISSLQNEGYHFVTVPELLGLPIAHKT